MSLIGKFATVGSATMASRVLGFAREAMIGAMLSAGPVADAFYAAFRFPNLFRRIFAERLQLQLSFRYLRARSKAAGPAAGNSLDPCCPSLVQPDPAERARDPFHAVSGFNRGCSAFTDTPDKFIAVAGVYVPISCACHWLPCCRGSSIRCAISSSLPSITRYTQRVDDRRSPLAILRHRAAGDGTSARLGVFVAGFVQLALLHGASGGDLCFGCGCRE